MEVLLLGDSNGVEEEDAVGGTGGGTDGDDNIVDTVLMSMLEQDEDATAVHDC